MHNLVHVVEMIFEYVGFPYTWSCIQVNHLWHDFLSNHFFPRWAEQMLNHDMSLCEIYEPEEIESMSAGKFFLYLFTKNSKVYFNFEIHTSKSVRITLIKMPPNKTTTGNTNWEYPS